MWENHAAQIHKQVSTDATTKNTSIIQSCDHCNQCELTISLHTKINQYRVATHSGNFQVEENLWEYQEILIYFLNSGKFQGIFKILKISNFFLLYLE